MTIAWHEETLWDLAWLLFGVPVMVTGFLVGAEHDDKGLMVGTTLIIMFIPYASRKTLFATYERIFHVLQSTKEADRPAGR